jgi:23S rRNA (guanosine2251-2'-O)-methyltransferase
MRPAPGRWVYGRHVVEESLASANKVLEVWLSRERKGELGRLGDLAQRRGARVRWVCRRDLDRMCAGGGHQGMAARLAEAVSGGLREFLAGLSAEQKAGMVLVALDQVQDPHNFGAIARSAACMGVAGLLYPDRRNAPITQAVMSASAGAIQKLRTFEVPNLANALRTLKEAGFWVYGADMSGRKAWEVRFNRPLVLVVGSEGQGMRPLVRSCCDEVAAIPQSPGGVDSLNVSCAASVLLYEISRQK